jgi:hypothetical protein
LFIELKVKVTKGSWVKSRVTILLLDKEDKIREISVKI